MVTSPQTCHMTWRRLRAKPRQVSSVPLLSMLGTHGFYLHIFVVSAIRQNCVVCFDQFWFDFFVFLCVDHECLTGRLSPWCRTSMTTQTCWIAWETQVTIVNLGFDPRGKMPHSAEPSGGGSSGFPEEWFQYLLDQLAKQNERMLHNFEAKIEAKLAKKSKKKH